MKKATVKMVGLILTVTLMKTTISYVVSIITELPCFNMDGFLFNSVWDAFQYMLLPFYFK